MTLPEIPNATGKILVLEDDPGVGELEKRALERLGHRVHLATSGEAAVAAWKNERDFDLVLLDFILDGQDTGLNVFQRLQSEGCSCAAILVTGFGDEKILMSAMKAGVRDFVAKTTDFLSDLPIAVERVMRHVSLEREAARTAEIRDKQEKLEAAFDAAQLGYWSWDVRNDDLRWDGHHRQLFGFPDGQYQGPSSAFFERVHGEDRDLFFRVLEQARDSKSHFEHQFRIILPDGMIRWIQGKGKFSYDHNGKPQRMTAVVFDITDRKEAEDAIVQSHSRIQALNDRLQLSVGETHHRVKNSLQVISSLLNLQVREKGALTEDDVRKIIAHLQGFAFLHDLLTAQAQEDGNTHTVSGTDMCQRVLKVFSGGLMRRGVKETIDNCLVTSKIGSSLAVVLNELLSNALKHGVGDIFVTLRTEGQHGHLMVRNTPKKPVDPETLALKAHTGFQVIKLLATQDLGAAPEMHTEPNGDLAITVSFPILDSKREVPATSDD